MSSCFFLDVITSEKSLSPFGGEELSKILDLISHLQGAQRHIIIVNLIQVKRTTETTSKECSPHSICVIGASLTLWNHICWLTHSALILARFMQYFGMVGRCFSIFASSPFMNSPSKIFQLLRSILCTFRSWPVNISHRWWARGEVCNVLDSGASVFRRSPCPDEGTAKSLGG